MIPSILDIDNIEFAPSDIFNSRSHNLVARLVARLESTLNL